MKFSYCQIIELKANGVYHFSFSGKSGLGKGASD